MFATDDNPFMSSRIVAESISFLCAQKFDISNFNFSFGIFSTGLKKIGCNFHNKQNFFEKQFACSKSF